jgi:hypothetical protein
MCWPWNAPPTASISSTSPRAKPRPACNAIRWRPSATPATRATASPPPRRAGPRPAPPATAARRIPTTKPIYASAHGKRYLADAQETDWSKPLRKGNYATPTCAYCHMRNGQHVVADKSIWQFGLRQVNPNTAENKVKRERWVEVCTDCHDEAFSRRQLTDMDRERAGPGRGSTAASACCVNCASEKAFYPAAGERPPYPTDWMDRMFPKERIGFFEGQASSFYNVSPIERDYFEMWYFANLGAYKAAAHGAPELVEGRPRTDGGRRRSPSPLQAGQLRDKARGAAARPSKPVAGRRVHHAQPGAQLMRASASWLLLLVRPSPAAAGKTCVDCHAGAAERSWALSKHGVIARIEAGRERAARAPDCTACHASKPKAPAPQHYPTKTARPRGPASRHGASCGACHSPRYVAGQLAAAQRGLAHRRDEAARSRGAGSTSARKEMTGPELARHREAARDAARREPARPAPRPRPPVARLPVVAGAGRARRQPAAHQGRAGRSEAKPDRQTMKQS